MERLAYRLADVVIATNWSYRQIAIERGGVRPEDVFVVRNGPDLHRFQPVAPDPAAKKGRRHLISYVGLMGPQDGIDHALHALAALRRLREDDWIALFIGIGEMLEPMRLLATELELDSVVEFVGWQYDKDVRRLLSSSDVCLAPDPPNPLNDRSTMVKIPEYLAMGCAVASYDLPESRVSAGDAAVYARPGDTADLGRCIDDLLNDPVRRERMGAIGRERVRTRLAWQHSAKTLLRAYEHLRRDAAPAAIAAARPAPARA
jgi:glycosyltransferase involved in cell wall biosynthesis